MASSSKSRTLVWSGGPDFLVVALDRVVQPGDEIVIDSDTVGDDVDKVADGLLHAAGFSEKGDRGGAPNLGPKAERKAYEDALAAAADAAPAAGALDPGVAPADATSGSDTEGEK